MTPIKTNNITILLVEVPEDTKLWSIDNDNELYLYVSVSDDTPDIIGLGKGQYQILGKSTELSEEQMNEICASDRHNNMFIDFKEESTRYAYLLKSVQESYLSLLEANGIDNNKSHLVLKRI